MNKQELQDLIETKEAVISTVVVGCDTDPKIDLKCGLEVMNFTRDHKKETESADVRGIKINKEAVMERLKKWDNAIWEHRVKNTKKKVWLASMLHVKDCDDVIPAKQALAPCNKQAVDVRGDGNCGYCGGLLGLHENGIIPTKAILDNNSCAAALHKLCHEIHEHMKVAVE